MNEPFASELLVVESDSTFGQWLTLLGTSSGFSLALVSTPDEATGLFGGVMPDADGWSLAQVLLKKIQF